MSAWTFLRKKWGLASFYLLLLFAYVFVEYGDRILNTEGCERIPLHLRLMHQKLCTAGYLKPHVRSVRLITLDKNSEPVQDRCEGRAFMAKLLSRLEDLGPALVVIDKWYSPGTCADSPGTVDLKKAIVHISKHVPVVLAEDSDTLAELRASNYPDVDNLVQHGFTVHDQLVREERILPEEIPSISYGLARLNCDTRRIPLAWQVYRGEESVVRKNRTRSPSLALAAASVADKDVETNLRPFLDRDEHPFASFLSESRFKPTRAIQIVCGKALPDPTKWRECHNATGNDFDLRNKVVVVGEHSADDVHHSVIGDVVGVVLQANYLEALLGDRYFRSINRGAEVFLALTSFVIIYFIFEKSSSPHFGLLWAFAFVLGLWVVSYFAIVQWGYLLTFWAPSVLGAVAKYFDSVLEHNRESRRLAND